MAARIKGRKLKNLPDVMTQHAFIKDFNSSELNFLSLMNDKTREQALEKTVVDYYTHKCNSGDRYRVYIIADEKTINEWGIK